MPRKLVKILTVVMIASLMLAACTPAPAPTAAPQTQPTTAVETKPTAAPAPQPPAEPAGLEGLTDAQKAWAKAAELGPYAPKAQDWAAIEAAAKKEGKVVLYSNSSRWVDIKKTFEEAYPGITLEGYDISTVDLITKLQKEQQAGVYNADVVLCGDYATLVNEMLNPPTKLLWNFYPDEIVPLADKQVLEPLLRHRYALTVFIYNNEVFKEPPVKNLWDYTKPEWKGRVVYPDPQKVAMGLMGLTAIVQNSDAMAKAYEEAFGKPIQLDAGVPNAGYQWIKDLLKNDVSLTSSSGDAATAVGTLGQKNPPIGFTSYSKIRNAQKGEIAFDVMWGMAPTFAVTEETSLAVANQAQHPNAAKLLIRWMLGDEKGGMGFTPFYVPGDYPIREDAVPPKGAKPWSEFQGKVWTNDPTWVYENAIQVRDFWVANLAQ